MIFIKNKQLLMEISSFARTNINMTILLCYFRGFSANIILTNLLKHAEKQLCLYMDKHAHFELLNPSVHPEKKSQNLRNINIRENLLRPGKYKEERVLQWREQNKHRRAFYERWEYQGGQENEGILARRSNRVRRT